MPVQPMFRVLRLALLCLVVLLSLAPAPIPLPSPTAAPAQDDTHRQLTSDDGDVVLLVPADWPDDSVRFRPASEPFSRELIIRVPGTDLALRSAIVAPDVLATYRVDPDATLADIIALFGPPLLRPLSDAKVGELEPVTYGELEGVQAPATRVSEDVTREYLVGLVRFVDGALGHGSLPAAANDTATPTDAATLQAAFTLAMQVLATATVDFSDDSIHTPELRLEPGITAAYTPPGWAIIGDAEGLSLFAELFSLNFYTYVVPWEQVAEAVFDVPIATATVDALEAQDIEGMSAVAVYKVGALRLYERTWLREPGDTRYALGLYTTSDGTRLNYIFEMPGTDPFDAFAAVARDILAGLTFGPE